MNAKLDDLFARWDENKLDMTRYAVLEWLRGAKARRLLEERGYIVIEDMLNDIPHFSSEVLSIKHGIARSLTALGWRKSKANGRTCYRRPIDILGG